LHTACAQLGDWRPAFVVCERLLQSKAERTYPLTAEVGFGLVPGPSLLRGLGWPTAELALKPLQRARSHAILYTACLAPDHHVSREQLLRLARTAAKADRSAAALAALGAAQYRAGQFAEAAATLEEAVELHGKDGSNVVKLFLAMAYQQQQQADRARDWLARAQAKEGNDEPALVRDRLRQEAVQLLKLPPNPKP
jgi:tetratricopeptide (TPR) repeat protein